MKLNKSVADWAKVKPLAVVDGSLAQAENVLTMALQDIRELGELLRRADNVVTWETTPNGSSFQDEIEAALGIK